MLDSEETARRIKAARMVAGIASASALAERIGSRGLGDKTLRKIESGVRPARLHELQRIASACGLPVAFFTLELDELGQRLADDSPPDIEAAIAAVIPEIESVVTARVLRRLGVD